jgi:hypothetical protein
MLRALALATSLLSAPPAWGDAMELEVSLAPTFALIDRHDALARGAGGGVRVGYGVLPYNDVLSVEAALGCERFNKLDAEGVEVDRVVGVLQYDATRCTFGPAVALRYGARLVGTGALGAAYRYERRTNRDFGTLGNTHVAYLEDESVHELVFSLRGGVEYRVIDLFAVGATAAVQHAVGATWALDLTLALTLSIYVYP